MPFYAISYDLRQKWNYDPLSKRLRDWGCARVHDWLWVAELSYTASEVRDVLAKLVDKNDSVIVLELATWFDWAGQQGLPEGEAWLKYKSP